MTTTLYIVQRGLVDGHEDVVENLKAFTTKAAAEAFRHQCVAYERTRPPQPKCATREEYDAQYKTLKYWYDAHPGGQCEEAAYYEIGSVELAS